MAFFRKKKEIPIGLWMKCPSCGKIVRAAPRLRKMEQQNLAVMAAVCQFLQDHCQAIGQLAPKIELAPSPPWKSAACLSPSVSGPSKYLSN